MAKYLSLIFFFNLAKVVQAASLAAPQVAIPITLEVKSAVTVKDSRVYLSDLVTCLGSSICSQILNIDVGAAPAPDRFSYFSSRSIAEAVISDGFNVQVILAGAKKSKVRSAGMDIDVLEIAKDIRHRLEKISTPKSRFSLIRVNLLGKRKIPFARYRYDSCSWVKMLGAVRKTRVIQKKVSVFAYDLDTGAVVEIPVAASLKFEVKAVVLKSSKSRGNILEFSSAEAKWVEGSLNKNFFSDISEVQGKKLLRNMAAGSVLKSSDLARPLLVKRGDVIHLLLQKGGVSVSGKAKALRDGELGEIIRVRTQGLNKVLRVEVIGDRKGKVRL